MISNPLTSSSKLPDYDERSKLASDTCDQMNREALQEAKNLLFQNLPKAVKKLELLIKSSDESVSLNAIREVLKAGGLYIEKYEHSGPGGKPLGVIVLPPLMED